MTRRLVVAGAIAATAACALPGKAIGVRPVKEGSALDFGLAQIDTLVRRWMDSGVYPGAGLVIYRAGALVFERYYGACSSQTAVHVASAGKWPAAATIAALVDEGRLRWDDPAARFVPGLNPMMGRATLRQLLSHTAGFPDYQPADRPPDQYQTLAEAVDHIRPLRPDAAPGTRFRYGGLAMQVAGRMAEIAAGQRWDDLFRTRIAAPLGMTRSGYLPVSSEPGFGPMLGGGFHTSARDFAAFLAMIAADGRAGGRRLLSAAGIAEMQRDQVGAATVPPLAFVDQARAGTRTDVYGLGVWREEVDANGAPVLLGSAGWAGAYPWIDKTTDSFGMFIAKADVQKAKAIGFQTFLSSPTLPWLARDAFAPAVSGADMRQGMIAVAGGELFWEASGWGPPLILLHGHSFDRTMWDPQMAALRRSFRVIRYDLRGYGRSSLPGEGMAVTHAGDLVRLMDGLNITKAHLCGLSLGGAVVTDMLALHPDRMLSGIAASGDIFDFYPAPGDPWTETAIAERRAAIATLRAGGIWAFKRDWLDQLTVHGGTRVETIRPKLWEMISKWSAWQPLHIEPRLILGRAAPDRLRARRPDVPVLVLTPEIDANEPNALLPLVSGARRQIIRDAGHVTNLEQPEAFTAAVLQFIRV